MMNPVVHPNDPGVVAGVALVRAVCSGDVREVARMVTEKPELGRVLTAAEEGRTTALIEASRRGHVKVGQGSDQSSRGSKLWKHAHH